MLRKFSSLSRPVTQLTRQSQKVGVRRMGDFKPDVAVVKEHQSGLAALPIPKGSWQEYYNQRNSRWNMYLGASLVLCVVSLFAANAAGVFAFHEIKNIKKIQVSLD